MTSDRSITSGLRASSYVTDNYRSRRVIHRIANVTQRISINGSIGENDIFRPGADKEDTKSPSPIQSQPRRMRIMSKEDKPSSILQFKKDKEASNRYTSNDSFTQHTLNDLLSKKEG